MTMSVWDQKRRTITPTEFAGHPLSCPERPNLCETSWQRGQAPAISVHDCARGAVDRRNSSPLRTESLPTVVSVAGKRDFQGGEKSVNMSREPRIRGLRDQAVE